MAVLTWVRGSGSCHPHSLRGATTLVKPTKGSPLVAHANWSPILTNMTCRRYSLHDSSQTVRRIFDFVLSGDVDMKNLAGFV